MIYIVTSKINDYYTDFEIEKVFNTIDLAELYIKKREEEVVKLAKKRLKKVSWKGEWNPKIQQDINYNASVMDAKKGYYFEIIEKELL